MVSPDQTEWPSAIRAAAHDFDGKFRRLRELDMHAAQEWPAARLEAEWALSDGDGEAFEKWDARADAIEAAIRAGRA